MRDTKRERVGRVWMTQTERHLSVPCGLLLGSADECAQSRLLVELRARYPRGRWARV
jgi:hypothetical protein